MKSFISICILLLLSFNPSIGQENPAESIEFPTINNNENIDLSDTVPCESGEHPDSAKKRKEQRRSVREIVKGKNFGFYTDIIIGGIVLVVGFIAWKIYQRFGNNHIEDDEDEYSEDMV